MQPRYRNSLQNTLSRLDSGDPAEQNRLDDLNPGNLRLIEQALRHPGQQGHQQQAVLQAENERLRKIQSDQMRKAGEQMLTQRLQQRLNPRIGTNEDTDQQALFQARMMAQMQRRHGGFRPESANYDMEGALRAGLRPDATGHWPSRDPATGMLLKGRGHPTWPLTVQGEAEAGYDIQQGPNNRYYSRPR